MAIAALLNSMENLNVVIYSGNDGRSKEQILENVQAKFGISVSVEKAKNLTIVFIATRTLLSAEHYPVATMLGQSLGAIVVTFDCLLRYCPDIYCDTTGAAFGYPVAKMFGCSVVTYTHYPHISTVCFSHHCVL